MDDTTTTHRTAGRITGRVRIEVRNLDGRTVATRRAANTVVRSGAELVAALFAGTTATPLNGMAIGTNPEPIGAPYEVSALTAVDSAGQPLVGGVAAAILAGNITIETIADEQRVLVSIRGVVPAGSAGAADGGTVHVGEAALGVLSPDGTALTSVYNRVVFEPIPKRQEHELALYWEISFPYGG